jgi:hypothetical protein
MDEDTDSNDTNSSTSTSSSEGDSDGDVDLDGDSEEDSDSCDSSDDESKLSLIGMLSRPVKPLPKRARPGIEVLGSTTLDPPSEDVKS